MSQISDDEIHTPTLFPCRSLSKDAPLRPLFLADKEAGAKPNWTFNMLLKDGVRSCLEYAKSST